MTRVELNKRARRKEQQKKEAEAKKAEELSKDIEKYILALSLLCVSSIYCRTYVHYLLVLLCSLPDILQEIAKEDEKKQKRHLRKAIAKQERLKACPPRLGKYKYASIFLSSHFRISQLIWYVKLFLLHCLWNFFHLNVRFRYCIEWAEDNAVLFHMPDWSVLFIIQIPACSPTSPLIRRTYWISP